MSHELEEGHMLAVTICEPFATLIVLGEKLYETRSWQPRLIGGARIAIHAGANRKFLHLMSQEPFREVLAKHDITSEYDLHMGCVLATAEIPCVHPTEGQRLHVSQQELAFGNWGVRRFAWQWGKLRKLKKPIYAKGSQSIWPWKYPEGFRDL